MRYNQRARAIYTPTLAPEEGSDLSISVVAHALDSKLMKIHIYLRVGLSSNAKAAHLCRAYIKNAYGAHEADALAVALATPAGDA